jgi:hypothetical protein
MVDRDASVDEIDRSDVDSQAEPPDGSKLAWALFAAAVSLYLLTRMIGIVDYPIYFFCDEAVQSNLASDFLRDGFRNEERELLPTYFKNQTIYNLSTSVYAQVIPVGLFGRSILVTRMTTMLITVLAAVWISLTLKKVFDLRDWWSGALVLSIAPAWFLHSRTAFETTLMVTFYAGFVYEYLRYRNGRTGRLFPALLWGALSFYSYSPGRLVVFATGLLLLVIDLPYHWRQRRTGFGGLAFLILLCAPLVRFLAIHPTANQDQLRTLATYWMRPIPLREKFATFGTEYLEGLNPLYWFLPSSVDIPRHLMGPHPHILTWLLPLFAVGLVLTLISIRQPVFRVVVVTLVVAPIGAAVVSLGITRVLVYLVPATILIALGLNWVLGRVSRVFKIDGRAVSMIAFAALAVTNLWLLRTALVDGPTWCRHYSMNGMQWGARQLYAAVAEELEHHPAEKLLVSPDWANGSDELARFFFNSEPPFKMGTPTDVLHRQMVGIENWIFVTTPDELETLSTSDKIDAVDIVRTIHYPDGEPGFYFVRLRYADAIAEIMAADLAERRRLVEATVEAWGETLTVRHSKLDMGPIDNVFDGDPLSLGRTREANPFVLDIRFEHSHTISGARLVTGSAPVRVEFRLYPPGGGEPAREIGTGQGKLEAPSVSVRFTRPHETDHVRIDLFDTGQVEPANVHLWEVVFAD